MRSSNERLSFEQHGKLVNPIVGLNASDDISTVISLLIDVVDIVLTLFALKTNYSMNPASDVLQMLGIMAQLEQWELLSVLSDTAWRSLLLGCTYAGGDLMRQTSCVVYQCLNSFKRLSHIDTLTYGLYIRALGCKTRKVKTCKDNNNESILDASLYLDDMGVTWYLQRIALYEQIELTQSLHSHNNLESDSTSTSSNNNSSNSRFSRSRGNSPVPTSSNNSPSKPSSVQVKTEVIKLSSYKFNLISNDGLLRFKHPMNTIGLYPSIAFNNNMIEDTTTNQLLKDITMRMDKLYKDAIPLPKVANNQSSSSLSVISNSTNHKPLSRLSIGSTSASISVTNSPQTKSINDTMKKNENNMVTTTESTFSSLRGRFFGGKPKNVPNIPSPSITTTATNTTTSTSTTSSNSSPATITTASPSTTNNRWSFFPKTFSSPSQDITTITNIPKIPQVRNSVVKLAATLNFEDEDIEDVNSDEENENKGRKSLYYSSVVVATESESSINESIITNTSDMIPTPLPEEITTITSSDIGVVTSIETCDVFTENLSDSKIILSDITTTSTISVNTGSYTEINAINETEINTETTAIINSKTNLSEHINDTNKDQIPTIPSEIDQPPAIVAEENHIQVDVADIQIRILDTFHEEYIKKGLVIGIHCSSPCSNCKFIMTEEEILAFWSSG